MEAGLGEGGIEGVVGLLEVGVLIEAGAGGDFGQLTECLAVCDSRDFEGISPDLGWRRG